MPKWVKWAIGAVAVMYIFRDPAGSAHTVHEVITSAFAFLGGVGK